MKAFAVLSALAVLATITPGLGQSLPTLVAPAPSTPASPPVPPPSPPAVSPPSIAPRASPPSPSRSPSPAPSGGGGSSPSSPASPSSGGSGGGSGPTDADVLTFAYNLECLEGQFYSCAAFGTPLDTSITGNGPAPSSCKKANLNQTIATYAAELAREETAHVKALYTLLKAAGGSPVCPSVNIDTAFEAAAEAAFGQSGTPLSPTFDPYANDVFFLHGSFIFEDLGVSAYLGGQGLIQNATYRQYAGQVGNTEAYHAALDRTLLYPLLSTTPAYGKTVAQITGAIVAAINQLAGAPQLKYELTNQQGASISNVDSSGFVPVATPTQVLKVVTLGAANGQGGGFFPNNLVGNVKN